ncbi:MAG: DUF4397 domain-containing protein [Planctomycetes bacterium]|nr:DUF4397 domain-containing protein [Planctomycetota bacterium]
MKRLQVLLLAGLCASLPVAPVAADATVSVLHGVPDLLVDVYVNGGLALEDFAFGSLAGPLPLEAGDYALAVVVAGGDPSEPVLEGSVTLADGDNKTIAAHLAEDGTATLSVYDNDVTSDDLKKARLVVRHAAAAPAVDIALAVQHRLGRFSFYLPFAHIDGLTNPEQFPAAGADPFDLLPGTYAALICPDASGRRWFTPRVKPVAPPAVLDLEAGTAYFVHAVGSLETGSFQLVVQTAALETPSTGDGTVTVVHAVPGLTVDVYVNGALALPGFEPGTITDPLALPGGDYDIAIVPAGGDPATPAISGSATLQPGANVSIAAHLDADGNPTLSVFANDVSLIHPGQSRLVVRHAAAAPAVDISLYRWIWRVAKLENLANGQEIGSDVWSGTYWAKITPAGSDDPVIDPVKLRLSPHKAYIVYAYGTVGTESFGLLVQTIDLEVAGPRR